MKILKKQDCKILNDPRGCCSRKLYKMFDIYCNNNNNNNDRES